ncbi:M23 family metallopeptidase [Pelomonas sp. Root1237]|uniref:M23 family metallopeptidase n=1 Tax=Pelomonas sp. Root1237 TaxID=1736434 RepID=UPI0012FA5BCC|nr:M23 family metallopeptidase [Pelomonas sp. Root1237]
MALLPPRHGASHAAMALLLACASACSERRAPVPPPVQPQVTAPAVRVEAPAVPSSWPATAVTAASGPVDVAVTPADIADLQGRDLSIPLPGVWAANLTDTFGDGRTKGAHEALDIPAPMRTPVLAVEDGVVAKLFTSQRGGLTVYQFDPASRYAYYYAHLDGYAPGLVEGQSLRRCQLVGYVGLTGNSPAGAPHLHLAIFKLEPKPRWWRGAPVNPYNVLRGSRPCSAGG